MLVGKFVGVVCYSKTTVRCPNASLQNIVPSAQQVRQPVQLF